MNNDKRKALEEEILEYVRNEFLDDEEDEEELDASTPLISGGIVDSFSMVSLKRFLEKKFNIQTPDTEATPEAFDSVDNILNLLEGYIS